MFELQVRCWEKKKKKHTGGGGNALLHHVAKPTAKLTEVGVSKIRGTFFT